MEQLKAFLTGPNDAIGGAAKFVVIMVQGHPVLIKIK